MDEYSTLPNHLDVSEGGEKVNRPITMLTLSFPHGVTVGDAEKITQIAQKITLCGVSEGGFTPTTKYGLNVDGCEFSESEMLYIYGHDRRSARLGKIAKGE